MGSGDATAFRILTDVIGADAEDGNDGDYEGPDGMLCCGVCHEPKEHIFRLPAHMQAYVPEGTGTEIKRPRECRCQRDLRMLEERERAEREHTNVVKAMRAACFQDAKLAECTFSVDDRRDAKLSDTCSRYADKWVDMRDRNIGALLWGEVGGGKTFYAACIANALVEREIAVKFRNLPDLAARMSSDYGEGRGAVLEEVRRIPLLILDDLGFERTTPTGLENAFTIINTRYDSGKPLIVTTNLTPDEIKSPANLVHRRALDRIVELCPIVLQVKGGRRREIANNKRLEALEILYGGGQNGS